MRVRVSYRGRVQGVGFRATARRAAADFPITGWVRNEPDRSVLLEAQGDASDVAAFLARVASLMGPRIASAERYSIAEEPNEIGFRIDR